ncbi:TPA: hypothetical protein ACRZZH_003122 [Vibrio harveyi]
MNFPLAVISDGVNAHGIKQALQTLDALERYRTVSKAQLLQNKDHTDQWLQCELFGLSDTPHIRSLVVDRMLNDLKRNHRVVVRTNSLPTHNPMAASSLEEKNNEATLHLFTTSLFGLPFFLGGF